MTAVITIINGKEQSSISVFDRGLAYGDGVFETTRVQSGDIAFWAYHLDRLKSGLKVLAIPLDESILRQSIDLALTGLLNPAGVLKITVTRGQGGRGYSPPESPASNIIVVFQPFSAEQLASYALSSSVGVAVHRCQQVLPAIPELAGLKTLNQLVYVLASQERKMLLQYAEGLLFDGNGFLIEATARNVFVIKDGILLTPILDTCGVSGILQRVIIEIIAVSLGLLVEKRQLTQADLLSSDELFLSNSISLIWPVVSYNHKTWSVGNMTKNIQNVLEKQLSITSELAYSVW